MKRVAYGLLLFSLVTFLSCGNNPNTASGNLVSVNLHIVPMQGHITFLQQHIKSIVGVENCKLDIANQIAHIQFDTTKIKLDGLIQDLQNLNNGIFSVNIPKVTAQVNSSANMQNTDNIQMSDIKQVVLGLPVKSTTKLIIPHLITYLISKL